MRKILVVNPKGGCGKTTIATNLATYYAVWGVPTTLVDFDPQGSSLAWLKVRPKGLSPIHGIEGGARKLAIPGDTQRLIYDSPAQVRGALFARLIKEADVVLVPVLPSPIDIRAASVFVGEVLLAGKPAATRMAMVANRVRENTLIYRRLENFLNKLKVPFVTRLRDSQNYIKAAETGIGIFEMAPSRVEPDMEQWRPLINWIDDKSS